MHDSRSILRRGAVALAIGLSAVALPVASWAADAPAQAPQAYKHLDASPAGSYTIDPDHTGVQFSIGHAGVGLFTGVFRKVTGTYTFDPKNPKADKADITIPVSSLDTFLPMRDKDLLAAAFFDAENHPDIHFVSTSYTPKGARNGLLHGNLTLRGVTKPVTFKVHLEGAGDVAYLPKPWGGYLTGFTAETTIDRTDFGMSAYASGLGHKVHIRVQVEGVRTAP